MTDKNIPLDQIRPGRYQPRREFDALALLSLAESIRDEGLLNRVIVVANGNGYELLAGERRWRAHCALAIAGRPEQTLHADIGDLAEACGYTALEKWPGEVARGFWKLPLASATIPAAVLDAGPEAQHTAAVIDNLQRLDLNPIEEAHACRGCVNFAPDVAGPERPPCALVDAPPVEHGTPRAPDYGVWVSKEGLAVPRCERFQARELPAIQRPIVGGFTIADRDLVLGWYKQLADQLSASRARSLKLYGPLRWLTGLRPNLAKLWSEIDDDDIMMAILNIGISEAANGAGWTRDLEALDASGARATWRVMEWGSFVERERPYHWEDWPLPWKGG